MGRHVNPNSKNGRNNKPQKTGNARRGNAKAQEQARNAHPIKKAAEVIKKSAVPKSSTPINSGGVNAPAVSHTAVGSRRGPALDFSKLPWVANPNKPKGFYNYTGSHDVTTPSGHTITPNNKRAMSPIERFELDEKNKNRQEKDELSTVLSRLSDDSPYVISTDDVATWTPEMRLKYDPFTGIRRDLLSAAALLKTTDKEEIAAVLSQLSDDSEPVNKIIKAFEKGEDMATGRYSFGKDDSYFMKLNKDNYYREFFFNPKTLMYEPAYVLKLNAKMPDITGDVDLIGDYASHFMYSKKDQWYTTENAPEFPYDVDADGNFTEMNYDKGILLSDGTWVTGNYTDEDIQDFKDAWAVYCVLSNAANIEARKITEKMRYTAGWDVEATDSLRDIGADTLHDMSKRDYVPYARGNRSGYSSDAALTAVPHLFKNIGGYLKTYLYTPFSKGDMQTALLNGLVNLGETCDYAGLGVRAVFAPGLGIKYDKGDNAWDRLVKAYTTHNNFDPDTGSFVKDMGIYMLDPALFFTIGSLTAAKYSARIYTKSAMKPLFDNLNAFYSDASKYMTPLEREYKSIARDIAFADNKTLEKHAVRVSEILDESDFLSQNYGGSRSFIEDEVINTLRDLQNKKSFNIVKGTAGASDFINGIDNFFLAGGLYLPYTVLKTFKGTRSILRQNKFIAKHLNQKNFNRYLNARRIYKNYSGGGSILDFHHIIDGFKNMKSLDTTEALKVITMQKTRWRYLQQQRDLASAISEFVRSSNGFTNRLILLNNKIEKIFSIDMGGSGPKSLDALEKHLVDISKDSAGISPAIEDILSNMLTAVRDAKTAVTLAQINDADKWLSEIYKASTSREVEELFQQYLSVNSANPVSKIENVAIDRYKWLVAEERGIDKELVVPPDNMVLVNAATANKLDTVPLSSSNTQTTLINSEVSAIPRVLGDAPEAVQKSISNLRDALEKLIKTDSEGHALKNKYGGVKLTVESYYVQDLFNYFRHLPEGKLSRASISELTTKLSKALDSLRATYDLNLGGLPTVEELSDFLNKSTNAKKDLFIYKGDAELMTVLYKEGVFEYYTLCRAIETPTDYVPPKKIRDFKAKNAKYLSDQVKLTQKEFGASIRAMSADPHGVLYRKRKLKNKLKNTYIEKDNGVKINVYDEYVNMVGELNARRGAKEVASGLINELDIAFSDLSDAMALTSAEAERMYEVNMAMSAFRKKVLNNPVLMHAVSQFHATGRYGYLIEYNDEIYDFIKENNEAGRDVPNVDKLHSTIENISEWCKALDAYSNFEATLNRYKLSPRELDAVLEYCLGKNPEYLHDMSRNPEFVENLENGINKILGFDNLAIDAYKETVLRTSFIDESVWLPQHLEHVVACEKELINVSKSDVKLQILQAIELDPDAIKTFNNISKTRDVYFVKAVTDGGTPYSPVVRIEMQKWVPVNEDITLPELLTVLNSKTEHRIFEISDNLTEEDAIKNVVDILDNSIKTGPDVKRVSSPTIVTHGRDVFDIDVLRQCCYRNKVTSSVLSDTNLLFNNRINTFKKLLLKYRNHNCIDPDKIPHIAEALITLAKDLPDDTSFGIFNISQFGKDIDKLFDILGSTSFIKEVSEVYDIDSPFIKQLIEDEDIRAVNTVYKEGYVIKNIIDTLERRDAAGKYITSSDAPKGTYAPSYGALRAQKARLSEQDASLDTSFGRLVDDIEDLFASFEFSAHFAEDTQHDVVSDTRLFLPYELTEEFAVRHADVLNNLFNYCTRLSEELFHSGGFDDFVQLRNSLSTNLDRLNSIVNNSTFDSLFSKDFVSELREFVNELSVDFEKEPVQGFQGSSWDDYRYEEMLREDGYDSSADFIDDSYNVVDIIKAIDMFIPHIEKEIDHLEEIVDIKNFSVRNKSKNVLSSDDIMSLVSAVLEKPSPSTKPLDLNNPLSKPLNQADVLADTLARAKEDDAFLEELIEKTGDKDVLAHLEESYEKIVARDDKVHRQAVDVAIELDEAKTPSAMLGKDLVILPETHDLCSALDKFLNTIDVRTVKVFEWAANKEKYASQFDVLKDLYNKYKEDINIPESILDNLAIFSKIADNIQYLKYNELKQFVGFLDLYNESVADLLISLYNRHDKVSVYYEDHRKFISDQIEDKFIVFNQNFALLQQELMSLERSALNRAFKEALGVTEASPFIRDVFKPAFENIHSLGFGTLRDSVKKEIEELDHIRAIQTNSCLTSDMFEGFDGMYSKYDLPLGTSAKLKYDATGQAFTMKKAYDIENAERFFNLSQTRLVEKNAGYKSDILVETAELVDKYIELGKDYEIAKADYNKHNNAIDRIKTLNQEREIIAAEYDPDQFLKVSEYDETFKFANTQSYKMAIIKEQKAAKRYNEISSELARLNIDYHNAFLTRADRKVQDLRNKMHDIFDQIMKNCEWLKITDGNDNILATKTRERDLMYAIMDIVDSSEFPVKCLAEVDSIPAHELKAIHKFSNQVRYIRDVKFKGSFLINEISTIDDWHKIIMQTKKHAAALDASSPYHYLIYLKEPDTIEEAFIVADLLYNKFYKHFDALKSIGLTNMDKGLIHVSNEHKGTVERMIRAGFNSMKFDMSNKAALKLLQGNGIDLVYKGVTKSYFESIYYNSKIVGKHLAAANLADVIKTQTTREGWAKRFASEHDMREDAFKDLEYSQIELLKLMEDIADTPYEKACRLYLDNLQDALYKAQTLQVMDFITKDADHLITHLLYHNNILVLPLKYSDDFNVYGKYLTKLKSILDSKPEHINVKFDERNGEYLWVSLDRDANPRIINDTKHVKTGTQFELDGKIYDPTELNEAYRHIDISDDIEFTEEMLEGVVSKEELFQYCNSLNKYIRDAYNKLNFLTEGAIQGSSIAPYSLTKHRYLRKAAPIDWLANSIRSAITCDQRLYHTSQFDFTILGENEFRFKLGGAYDDTDILQNIKYCYDDLAGTVSTERMYIANFFDDNSHCRLEELFKGFSNSEVLTILKNNPDQCVLTLVADKNTMTGFRVQKLGVTDELSIDLAKSSRAIVVDYETYVEMTRILNSSEFDKTWMKVWARVVFFMKVGHLCNPGTWMRNWIDATIKASGEVDGNIAQAATYQVKAMKYLFEYNKIVKDVRDNYGIHHINSKRMDKEWNAIQLRTETTLTRRQFDFIESWLKVSLSGGESRMLQEMLKKQKYDLWRSGNLKPGDSFTSSGLKQMQDEYDYIGSDIFRFEQIGEDEIINLIEEGQRKGEEIFVDDFSVDEFWQIFNQRKNPQTSYIENPDLFQKYTDTVENILAIRSNNLFRKNRSLGSQVDYMCSFFLKPMSKIEQVVRLGQFLMLEEEGFTRSEIFKSIADTQFEYELKSSRIKGAELIMTYFNFEYNNLRYWCNMLENRPEYLYMLESLWNDVSWEAAQQYYEDEDIYNNKSITYMMANGALPIGKSGLYLKMFPSALGALNWFYGMPSQAMTSIVPPVEFLAKEMMYRMGSDYAQLWLNNLDYNYSNQEEWERLLSLVPIAGTMYTRYWEHFTDRKPWTRLDDGTLGQELVKWNPTIWGAVYKYNKPHKDDFDAFQKTLAKQDKWYDLNLDKVVDIKYKNTNGLNNPDLPFDSVCTYKAIFKNEVWDSNWGSFKKYGHFTSPSDKFFYRNGRPKELGLNRYRNLDAPGEWESLEDDMLKYHDRKWDRNTDKFILASEWKEEKLNRSDLSFPELQEYMAEKGRFWDYKDHKFKRIPEIMEAYQRYNNGYYYRGWREFKRWVNYGNNPPAQRYDARRYSPNNIFSVSGKPFSYTFSTSDDNAALRMALSGYKAYDEYYSSEYQYNYRYRSPNPINHMRRYNPILRYHIIPT